MKTIVVGIITDTSVDNLGLAFLKRQGAKLTLDVQISSN